ncbi:HlyC/CorC family transporter [candidate division TA06 bacterium]|uniref:HlyC/CorC family transporter n=1 Tax=candidate division TA06 bacterium TaxID=2250710 RepID=A0A933MKR6_UNCT6|nr:HlyC/CorC family transporter [candidate division TA06 bacterium]
MIQIRKLLKKLKLKKPDKLTIQELQLLLAKAVAQNALTRDEGHMMQRILSLSQTPLWEVMIPLPQASSIEASAKVDQIIDLCLKSGHSRFPVYEKTPDNIIGIIHVKEVLRLWRKKSGDLRAVEFIRLPVFLPQTIKVSQALSEFRRKKISIALAIDEYGAPAGLITSEDLTAEIVGQMQDELDREYQYLIPLGGRSFSVDARMPLDKFAGQFKVHTESKAHSLAGFLFEELQRIPLPGESFKLQGLEFTVTQGAASKIYKLKVSPGKKY